jgi:hypothetical protein
VQDEAEYVCGSCGELIVVPVDVSQGARQRYVEDCPVCCRANTIVLEFDADGQPHVTAELE